MSQFDTWVMPVQIPPNTARAQDGSRVRITPNPAVPVPAVIATPLLAAQTHTWTRPAASVCFPLHPLGVMTLYERARQLLTDTDLPRSMSPEQLNHTEACIWRFAAKVFKGGEPIRSRLDLAVDERHFEIRDGDDRDPFVAQPVRLASWLVTRAAVAWAREAEA